MNEHEFPLAENDRISITLAELENDGMMLNEGTPKPERVQENVPRAVEACEGEGETAAKG